MKHLSLRVRLVGMFVLLYGTLFVLLLGWMMMHIQVDFIEEVDRNLVRSVEQIEMVLHRGPQAVDSLQTALNTISNFFPRTRFIYLHSGDAMLFQSSTALFTADGDWKQGTEFFTHRKDDEWFRIIRVHEGEQRIQLAESITAVEHTLIESFILVLLSIPIVILLSVVSGYYLVRRVLRPLNNITSMARDITAEHLGRRIPRTGTNDEVGRVVVTLNDMIERLERSFIQLEQFAANAAHELRTPLTILKGELEVALRRSRSTEDYRRILSDNLDEVVRISHTVDQLFLLSRMDNNTVIPEYESVDLNALLEEVASEAGKIHVDRGIRITLTPGHIPDMNGDVIMLANVFLNLVENAVKYNKRGGSVHITTMRSYIDQSDGRSMIRVDVSDTGIGISAKDIPLIFDRFYRADNMMAYEQRGAGLGLSIARWIVEMHGGSITVCSTPGKGSTFSVFLPST